MNRKVLLSPALFFSAVLSTVAHGVIPCFQKNEFAKDVPDLVHEIRMYGKGPETRKELSEIAAQLDLSPDEVAQLKESVGAVLCPQDGRFPGGGFTAFLAGSNQEIITVAHPFVNARGERRDLSKCFFENFEEPPQRVYLSSNSRKNLLPNVDPAANDRRGDRARIALQKPIRGARFLKIDSRRPERGEKTALITAQNSDFKMSGKDPVAVPCEFANAYTPGYDFTRVQSCCNYDRGGSGGPYVARGSEGLVVRAMQVSMLAALDAGKVPNKVECSLTNNSNIGVGFDDGFGM